MATVLERFIETLDDELRRSDETATEKQPRLKWLSSKSVRSESSLLRPYIDELDTIAMLKGIARPDVNFCTLLIDDVNPITVPVAGTRNYLSCIDRRCWDGLHTLSRLLAECIGHKSFALYVDPQGLDRVRPLLRKLIEGGFRNGPPTDALARLGAYDRMRFWAIIDEAMHSALIAREYAHFIAGHFPGRATSVPTFLRKGGTAPVTYPALCTTWDDEFKADLIAMDLVMRRLGKHFADLGASNRAPETPQQLTQQGAIMGIQAVFCLLYAQYAVERCGGLVFSTASRHPPTILRLVNCWSLVGAEIIPDQPFLDKIANERLWPFYDVFDDILDDSDSSSARRANGCSECEFQTLVFRAVRAFTHATTLRLLEWCSQHLDAVMSGSVDEPSQNPACFDWCRLLYEERQKHRVSEHECASMLNRCAAVVEQSARMQGVRVE